MKTKTVGILLSLFGIIGIMTTILLVNTIDPCCDLFLQAYHQILTILVPIFLVVLIFGLYLFFKQEKKIKIVRTRITKILTPDEKSVINALKNKDSITQADLCRKLDFSKAKLSMLLEKMQKRGLVKKIKRGRTNLVVLKKKL